MNDEPRNSGGVPASNESAGPRPADTPRLKVVDRRWWAKEEKEDPVEDTGEWEPRKPTYLEELERQLADKDQSLQNYMVQYKQAVTEFEDVKARIRRDVSKDVERGRRAMLVELVEILDNLERAMAAARETRNFEAVMQGLGMVERLFAGKLEAFGVKRIEALGQMFDPAHHEAVATVPTPDADRDGTIVGVVQPGYAIGDDVLRPAMVAVAKLTADG